MMDAAEERVEANRALFGTVEERADRALTLLTERGDLVAAREVAAEFGWPAAVVGGALSRLIQRGDAVRCGRRGFRVV